MMLAFVTVESMEDGVGIMVVSMEGGVGILDACPRTTAMASKLNYLLKAQHQPDVP